MPRSHETPGFATAGTVPTEHWHVPGQLAFKLPPGARPSTSKLKSRRRQVFRNLDAGRRRRDKPPRSGGHMPHSPRPAAFTGSPRGMSESVPFRVSRTDLESPLGVKL